MEMEIPDQDYDEATHLMLWDMYGQQNSKEFKGIPPNSVNIMGTETYRDEDTGRRHVHVTLCQDFKNPVLYNMTTGKTSTVKIYRDFDFNKFDEYILDPRKYWRDTLTFWQRVKKWWRAFR